MIDKFDFAGRALAVAIFLGLGISASAPLRSQPAQTVQIPEDMEEESLAQRQRAQIAALATSGVDHAFKFTNRIEDSGITFEHRIVDDAGLHYKAVHYDHGNGIAAADVDGDEAIDVYFLSQIGPNELWKNVGGGRFENITTTAGVALEDRISVAGSFADIDNDGDADLFVTTVKMGNVLFLNDGKGRFQNISHEAGVDHVGHSSGAVFFDYDNDGWLDLFLTNIGTYTTSNQGRGGYYIGLDDAFTGHMIPERSERSILYRNLGDLRFEDVSEKVLLIDRSWSGDASVADFNRDGFQDLYVLNMQGLDHYYENIKGRFFVDKTMELFPKSPPGAMGVKVFDWNRDGLMDLLLTDMHSDMGENIGPEREKLKPDTPFAAPAEVADRSILGNAFFENTGSGFREISDSIGVESYWPWGVSVDDLNADGWDDIFISASMNYPFRYGINSLLLNNHGKSFVDAEFALGVEPRKDSLTRPWFEIDCGPGKASERKDSKGSRPEDQEGSAFDVNVAAARSVCDDRSGKVTVLAARGSRAAVVFDVDSDGDLDIITNDFNDRPQLLISDLAENEIHYSTVKLIGTQSNRSGLGAVVTVHADGGSQTKVHDGKSGYLSQSQLPLYFGLGGATSIERIEVAWPSGVRQVIQSPPLNSPVTVVEMVADQG